MRLLLASISIVLALAGSACSDSPTSPSGDTPRLVARIDGAAWQSASGELRATSQQPGVYQIRGATTGGEVLGITLAHITGTGRYPLGVGLSIPGGSATLRTSALPDWTTDTSGASGTIDITTATTERVTGTLSATLVQAVLPPNPALSLNLTGSFSYATSRESIILQPLAFTN